MAKSRFSGAAQAKVTDQGVKCSDGRHLLKIKRIAWSDGKNGEYYVVEFDVVKSGNPADPEGSERVWTQSMDKKSFPLPKLNGFAYAAMGYNHKNIEDAALLAKNITPQMEEILDMTQDESDPLEFVGRLVWADVVVGDAKPINPATQKPYKFHAYTFSPGQTDKLEIPAAA